MSNSGPALKDFLYLDAQRLYSYYSQQFEGVADRIVRSFEDSSERSQSQVGGIMSGSKVETQVGETSNRIENLILYDHLYNRFESKVDPYLVGPSDSSLEHMRVALRNAWLVKIVGMAEVEDYDRLKVFFENFNALGEAIVQSISLSEDMQNLVMTAEQAASEIQDRNKRAKAQAGIKAKTDAKSIAKSMGLRHDEQTLKNLGLFTRLFRPGGLDVTISPSTGDGEMVFRAPLVHGHG